jgi:hypothetical protein
VNSTEVEEVIRRLRAELDAANLQLAPLRAELDVANSRFSNLEQIPGSQGAPAPREFPLVSLENLPDPAGGSGAPHDLTQAPANATVPLIKCIAYVLNRVRVLICFEFILYKVIMAVAGLQCIIRHHTWTVLGASHDHLSDMNTL